MGWVAAAIVFAALLYKFPRTVIWTVVAATGVAAIGLAINYAWEQRAAETRQSERNLIKITVKVDPFICEEADFPLAIGVRNSNDFTINAVTFYINGRKSGFSKTIYRSSYTNDKIIAKHEFFASCWSLSDFDAKEMKNANLAPKDLEWDAELSYFDKAHSP